MLASSSFFRQAPMASKLFFLSLCMLFFLLPLQADCTATVLITCAFGLWAIYKEGISPRFLLTPASMAFGVFLVVIIASSLFNADTLRALPRVGLWLACVLIGLCASRIFPHHKFLFAGALLMALVYSAVLGAGYYLAGAHDSIMQGDRLKLFAVHPSRLALYAATGFYFALHWAMTATKKSTIAGAGALALLCGGLIVLSNTRALVLMLPAGIVVLLLALPSQKKGKLMALGAVLAAVLACGLWLTKESPATQRLISAVVNLRNDETFVSRLPIWEAGWAAFTKSPVLGNGIHSYKRLHKEYREENLARWQKEYPSHEETVKAAHNLVLGRLVEAGALGTAGFLVFYLWGTCAAWRRKDIAWVAAMLVFYLGIGLVDDPLWRMNDSYILLLAAAALGYGANHPVKGQFPRLPNGA
ncbi:O-antigen ligase family protein [Desulfovibrio cuneatus]|uniref:O-antigen ligase family protein n=1 Tax=Desulfovibrio cuneatus TaxID=159728 RepID=UPI000406DC8E|nr:O-antigen ligase family protein [Desulfovibrio cuneatus]